MKLIDVLFKGKEIKKLIVKRSFDLEIPLRHVCEHCNINYSHFMSTYINTHSSLKCRLTEDEILRVLETLGVSMRYQFLIDEDYDKKERKSYLKNKYDKRRKNKIYGPEDKGVDSFD
jgi:hypothetical protein